MWKGDQKSRPWFEVWTIMGNHKMEKNFELYNTLLDDMKHQIEEKSLPVKMFNKKET